MGAGMKVLMGLRVIALITALVVVGLGAWSMFIINEVGIRGATVLERLQTEPERTTQYWRTFLATVANGTARIWISIAAASLALLSNLLVVLSLVLRRLEMPGSVRVPLELLSMSSMATAFGCLISFGLNLSTFSSTRLETSDSADLTLFTIIIPINNGLIITAGTGCFILLSTTITAMVQACLRARAKESCSFEPTASALGMGHGYYAIEPPVPRSRPPTMYDPLKPLPKQLDGMPVTDEEKNLAVAIPRAGRVDLGLSYEINKHIDSEKDATWPLNPNKSQQILQTRPSRPWSEMLQKKKSPGAHAM